MKQLPNPQGIDVAFFLGRHEDTVFVNQCDKVIELVRAWAESFTRGNGFTDDNTLPADLYGVIMSRAARMSVNPLSYVSEAVDTASWSDTAPGDWSSGELRILRSYREKTK